MNIAQQNTHIAFVLNQSDILFVSNPIHYVTFVLKLYIYVRPIRCPSTTHNIRSILGNGQVYTYAKQTITIPQIGCIDLTND